MLNQHSGVPGGGLATPEDHSGPDSGASEPALAIRVEDLAQLYPTPRSLLRLLALRRAEQRPPALDGVSFSVQQGEVLGLLGPNGAGKTTLINVLCGLLIPTCGRVHVGGYDVRRDSQAARRLVGLVTSNERSFYWRLTGRQNLRFFAELFRVPPEQIEPRIDEFLEALDLTEHADRRFDGYSTGIRQRFAFARGLMHRPRILFMDEPTKGLDPNAAASLLRLIRTRILPMWRPTILVTSHNLAEIEALCDRVAIMDQGRLLRIGTIAELTRGGQGRQTYRVQVDAVDDEVLQVLRSHLGEECVTVLELPPLTLELQVGKGSESLSVALRDLLDHGIELRRCEPVELSLAEVFRRTVVRKSAA